MRNRLFRNFLMAVVLVIGLLASAFIGSNNATAVTAETTANLPVVEFKYNAANIDTSFMKNYTNNQYVDGGSYTTTTDFVVYEYYINGTCVNAYSTLSIDKTIDTKIFGVKHVTYSSYMCDNSKFQVSNGLECNYEVKQRTIDYLGKKSISVLGAKFEVANEYKVLDDATVVESGSFQVALYSNVNLTVDTTIFGEGKKPSVTLDSSKVYYGESATITIEQVEDYNVLVNGKLVTDTTYTISDIKEDKNVTVKYEKSTDCKFIVDTTTISGATLKIKGTNITSRNNTVVVAEGETVTITATPDNTHLINAVKCNGVALENTAEYPNFSATYTVGTGVKYNITLEVVEATNTVTLVGEGVTLSGGTTLDRDSEVKLTLKPADNKYIVNFNINVNDYDYKYNNGNVEITFTTGVNENYVVECTTATMFDVDGNNVDINVYDVMLMIEGDEFAKKVVYESLLYDAFNANFDIDMADVKFEYLAGVYTLNLKETFTIIPSVAFYLIPETVDIDLLYPIDAANPATLNKTYISEYFYAYLCDKFGTIAQYITVEQIESVLDNQIVENVLASMHLFGSAGNELVKLTYAGNDYYKATTIECEILATDLREQVAFDVNENITVTYGSYISNSEIMDMILDGRNGVVALTGEQIIGLNDALILSADMVAKNVGTYTVTLTFPDSNFYYKGNSVEITITVSINI